MKVGQGEREKVMWCSENIWVHIVKGIIPFKDLDVGYLAEFSRTPPNHYNEMFFMLLTMHACKYFKCNVIDTEAHEVQDQGMEVILY